MATASEDQRLNSLDRLDNIQTEQVGLGRDAVPQVNGQPQIARPQAVAPQAVALLLSFGHNRQRTSAIPTSPRKNDGTTRPVSGA